MSAAGARPVRVACLAHGVGGRDSGVRRLILDQATAWGRQPGVTVGLFVRCEARSEEAWRTEPNVVSVRSSGLGIPGRFIAREALSLDLARWRPDVIYLRHSTISPSVLLLAAAFPTIVGGDLDDLDELKVRSRLRFWYMRFTRSRLLKRARRLMVVTPEIARHPSILSVGRPVDVFPNTIDVGAYPELRAPDNDAPHLVFIGAPGLPWAGLDKIIRLAQRAREWRFDVIGSTAEEMADVPSNVAAHGVLTREEYLPIMAAADVAIGPLALHRKGLSETSALKVAEYLAYGIPVILSTRETAFPDGAPFILRIPNSETNVEDAFDEIVAFVEAWRGRRVGRGAVSAIDVHTVEPERMRLILAESRRTAGAGT